ncbi:MAG TPA: acyltransferase [Devosiaceae bacterium]|jgi:peptidoglycan/LPS O-acetylase OafA/YrhL
MSATPNSRRNDLQGLRALAVLVVIGYHAGIPGFSGGFVGVDVFFVLSGFFIVRMLASEVEQHGRVRPIIFWAGRAKRLLPNSLLTLFVTLCATAALMPSYRFQLIAEDVAKSALFFANFHFASRAVDYFHLGDRQVQFCISGRFPSKSSSMRCFPG